MGGGGGGGGGKGAILNQNKKRIMHFTNSFVGCCTHTRKVSGYCFHKNYLI